MAYVAATVRGLQLLGPLFQGYDDPVPPPAALNVDRLADLDGARVRRANA